MTDSDHAQKARNLIVSCNGKESAIILTETDGWVGRQLDGQPDHSTARQKLARRGKPSW